MTIDTDFKYACVIVTFNRSELLIEAVNSVLAQSIQPKKIVIVNNASTDDTLDKLRKNFGLQNDKIQIINLKENKGGSYGFYCGLKAAAKLNVDWVSVSDDDAIFKDNFFAKIEKGTISNPEIMSFTGTVKLGNGCIQLSHRRRVVNDWTLKQIEVSAEEYKESFYLDTFTFVGAVFKTSLIEQIGLPHKEFFIWYDDTEYALRIRSKNKTINVSDAVVVHKTQPSAITGEYQPNWREYYGIRNEIITNKLHTSSKSVLMVYLIFKTLKKIGGILIRRKFHGFRLFELKILYHGTLDGLENKSGKNALYYPGMSYK